MKRVYISTIAALAGGLLAAGAAEPIQSQSSTHQSHEGGLQAGKAGMVEKGFIKEGNKIFKVERVTRATAVEGLAVDDQGNITKDGKRIELRDGQLVTPQGQVSQGLQSLAEGK